MAAQTKSVLQSLERRLAEIPGMSAFVREEYAVLVAEEKAASQIATLVKRARKDIGLSQAELGLRLGVSQARVSKLEQGDVAFGPSIGMLAKIASACGRALQFSFIQPQQAVAASSKAAVSARKAKVASKTAPKRRQTAA